MLTLLFLPLIFLWPPIFERLGALRKFVLRMGHRAISNICLMHKIALVWSISRNIFQPMDYAAGHVGYGTTKNIVKNIFLEHSTIHSAL